MDIITLLSFLSNIGQCIDYMRDKKLLPTKYICCRNECVIEKDNGRDGQIFRCVVCHKKKSIRNGSFFAKSKLKLQILLLIVYYFCTGVQAKQCAIHLKGYAERKSVMQWYTYCREICSLYLLTDGNIRLGGQGRVVQIDETFIRGKLKYERGDRKKRTKPSIIFGLIDTTSKQCLVRLVPDRTRDTLLPIIVRYVHLGTTIFSDEARMYFTLNQHGYVHKTVKHKEEYKAIDGTHTNSIENLWTHLKSKGKKMFGFTSKNFPLHLDEFVYKFNKKDTPDMFETFTSDIAQYYPV